MEDDLIHGRYRMLSEPGRGGPGGEGGQASVVEAMDELHQLKVALKISKVGDEASTEAVAAETRILLNLPAHPNLPRVRDGFPFDGRYVIVMEWIEGTDLAELLAEQGDPGLNPTLVVDVVAQTAAALDHLHAQQPPIVHGDVKPANLIRTPQGRVMLVDFGIAGAGGPRLRSGTRGFVAPEVGAGGPITAAADVYGLAASAVTLLTGQLPGPDGPVPDDTDPAVGGPMARVLRRALVDRPGPATGVGGRVGRAPAGGPSGAANGRRHLPGRRGGGNRRAVGRAPRHHEPHRPSARRRGERDGRGPRRRGGGRGADEGRKLVRFGQPSAAATAAVALHERVAHEPWPGGVDLAVKIALHTGEAELHDGSYTGPVLNRLSRLRIITPARQTVVSSLTADLIGPHLPPGCHLVELDADPTAGRAPAPAVFGLVTGEAVGPYPLEKPPPLSSDQPRREVEELQAALEEHRTATQLARHLVGVAERRRLAGDAEGAGEVEATAVRLATAAAQLGARIQGPETDVESARAP